MNPRFQIHPDGHVIIQNGDVLYIATRDAFVLDCADEGLPVPQQLPVSELYVPGGLHCGFTDGSQHAPALEDKNMLDVYIAAAARLVAREQLRQQQAMEEERKRKNADADAAFALRKQGG